MPLPNDLQAGDQHNTMGYLGTVALPLHSNFVVGRIDHDFGDKNRFYPLADKPRPERAVHNLEHGYVVAWYDSKLPADQVAHLQALASAGNLSRLLVVGWTEGDLPANKHIVLTSWGRTDRCTKVSDDVINSFYKAHLNSSLSPEAGLPAIQGADSYPANTLPGSSPAPSPSTSAIPSPSTSSTKK